MYLFLPEGICILFYTHKTTGDSKKFPNFEKLFYFSALGVESLVGSMAHGESLSGESAVKYNGLEKLGFIHYVKQDSHVATLGGQIADNVITVDIVNRATLGF